MRVVVATRNQGKLREDGTTFEDNALAKARQAAAATGLPALADDSGLEVDALGGAPGVYSARYSGEGTTPDAIDAANNRKLLEAMRDVPKSLRRCRYRCVAAFVAPSRGVDLWRAGACEGVLLEAPRGDGGFGYDPLFLVPARGQTMAEIPLPEKNRLSHRAAAFRALAAALATEGRTR